MKISSIILGAVGAASYVSALTPAQWRAQSVYQVITDRFARTDGSTTAPCDPAEDGGIYCNGTWQGLINHLNYIQDMGFTAIWISPVVKNLEGNTPDGSAYHGYWAQDIYDVNPHFGTAADLKALSKALHNRGMYLMVDIVTNHMAYYGCGECVDYSVFNPFNSQDYFHPYCEIDYSNATSIVDCWEGDNTVPLPDLRTENAGVQAIWNAWIKALVKNYTIDGLRLDSAQQTGSFFFPSFEKAAGVYIVGEDYNGDPPEVCVYQQTLDGVLNYPMYFYITQAFQDSTGSISNLAGGITAMQTDCKDTTLLGSFSENHDNPRFPSYTQDLSRAANVISFTLLQDGIPILYQGQEQHLNGSGVPVNREALWLTSYNTTSPLYTLTATLNALRARVISMKPNNFLTYKIRTVYTDANTIVTRKGATGNQIVGVYSNLGENGQSYNLTLAKNATGFVAGEAVMEVLSCTLLTADKKGNLAVPMAAGMPRILYPYAQVEGTRICQTYTTQTAPAPSPPCTPATILFKILTNTTYGQSVVVTGSIPALGTWNPDAGVYLSAADYTQQEPLWFGNATGIDPQEVVQYKFVRINSDGSFDWEDGDNRVLVAPGGCMPFEEVDDVWQG